MKTAALILICLLPAFVMWAMFRKPPTVHNSDVDNSAGGQDGA